MANLLAQYGIKEVADVIFYKWDKDNAIYAPVLFLDTLKVSTIEDTAENVSARGGKGNPELVMWDYNKEINVTLQDALYSPQSMAVMFGAKESETATATLTRWKKVVKGTETAPDVYYFAETVGEPLTSGTKGDADTWAKISEGDIYYVKGEATANASTLEINSDTFPGTYKIVGETYTRDENGDDHYFQFEIEKAKILSEHTLTMEAEGDPSVFDMNLKVLKSAGKPQMVLRQYEFGPDKDDTIVWGK